MVSQLSLVIHYHLCNCRILNYCKYILLVSNAGLAWVMYYGIVVALIGHYFTDQFKLKRSKHNKLDVYGQVHSVCDPWCALFRKLEGSHILQLNKRGGVILRWVLI